MASSSFLRDFARVMRAHLLLRGRLPRFWRQTTFTDMIAYRKLFPNKAFGPLSDKMLVREHVAATVGARHLVPLIAATTDIESFDFGTLPRRFVMKANHGSGWNKLVWDRDEADIEALRREAAGWLKANFHPTHSERHYKTVRPQIMFEELLLADDGHVARDYKINCFRKGGRLTQILDIHSSRFTGHHANFVNADWTPIDLSWGAPRLPIEEVEKPPEFEQMLALADRLSRGFNHVRVDLYVCNGNIYVGELTFTPAAGLMRFDPPEHDEIWGQLCDPDRPWDRYPCRISGSRKAAGAV